MNTKTFLKKAAITTAGTMCVAFSSTEAGRAAFLIDTTPTWNSTDITEPFGTPDTTIYGQTFTVDPTGFNNVLTNFSFWVGGNPQPAGGTVQFKAYIQAWTGIAPTGINLYTSSVQTKSGNTVDQFTFNTGGLDLTAGQQYVAYLEAINATLATTGVGFLDGNVYSGGTGVFNNGSWQTFTGDDLAFQANFVIPTPAMLPGLIGMGIAAWRKRKAEEAGVEPADE